MNYSHTYSNIFNILYNGYSFVSSRLPYGYALPPMRVSIETTYKCNLRCKMCFQQEVRKNSTKQKQLTTSEIKTIIDQIPSMAIISLTGGEIFVRSDALDIINYASHNHKCTIVSNAALITPQIAKEVVKSSILLFSVSIDGAKQLHNQIRGVPQTYSKAIRGLKLIQKEKQLQNKKYPLIDIKTVILPENVGHLIDIYNQVVKKVKADYFTISTLKGSDIQLAPPIKKNITISQYTHYNRFSANYDIKLLKKQINYITKNNQNTVVRFYPGNLNKHLKSFYHNKITKNDYSPCYFPWTSFNISPNGDAFPCIALQVGNTRQKKLSSIWNGKKMRDFRIKLKKQKVFPACHACCNLWLK